MEELLRKVVVSSEQVVTEGNRRLPVPYRTVAAAAVLTNPWAARGFVADLSPEVEAIAPRLGAILVPALLEVIGNADLVEAYGKAAVVGLNGEIEHAAAMIHTLRFGNILREAVSGTSFLPFNNKRASAGCVIDVPLKHKTADAQRSHFITASFSITDAPGPDELVVAMIVATGGRPHARIGDRFKDMKEMGVDQTGVALR